MKRAALLFFSRQNWQCSRCLVGAAAFSRRTFVRAALNEPESRAALPASRGLMAMAIAPLSAMSDCDTNHSKILQARIGSVQHYNVMLASSPLHERRDIWAEMRACGAQPNHHTYTILLQGSDDATKAAALRETQKLLSTPHSGLTSDVALYLAMIDAACTLGQASTIPSLLDLARGNGLLPTQRMYTFAMKCSADCGHPRNVLSIALDMAQQKSVGHGKAAALAMKALVDVGLYDHAERTRRALAEIGNHPSAELCCRWARLYAEKDNVQAMEYFLLQLRLAGGSFPFWLAGPVARCYMQARDLHGLDKMLIAAEIDDGDGLLVMDTVANAYFAMGELQKARKVRRRLAARKGRPDPIVAE